MKVLLNAHLLSFGRTYRAAGISRYIEHSVRALQRMDMVNQYELWTGPGSVPLDFVAGPNLSVRQTRLPTARPQARILWEQSVLPARLALGRYDLLHAMAFVQPLVCSKPSVVTFYDLSFVLYPERFNRLNREYLTRLGRRTAERCTGIIAISESTKRDLVRLFDVPPEKVDIVYPGVEEQFCRLAPAVVEEFRRRKGLPERFILHVGTLEPRKNLEVLVRAFARLKRDGLPHKLVLVGGRGWDCERIFAAIEEEGLARDVVEAGFAPEAELPLWYNAAELLTYPSVYEGFGLPPLEAMACGTPVACCAVASLPEVVGDAGALAPPNDVEALAEAVSLLLSEPGRREEAAARGLARAARFSWDEAARQTVRVYAKALARARGDAASGVW